MTRSYRLFFVLSSAFLALSLLLLPFSLAARRAAAATPPPVVSSSGGARIDEPRRDSTVRGTVKIMGTASLPDFQYYKFELQRPNSDKWEWKFELRQAVVNGQLWEWNTKSGGYPDGNYVLRLSVVRANGNFDQVDVPVRVDNSTTPTPSPTPTSALTPTPANTPTAIVVSTPVVIGVLPTATPAPTRPAATPTPMFGIDIAKLIDPAPWARAFSTGMVLAGAGIAFILALFIARALLRWRP
jgi:hypothetical protein